MTTVIDAGAAVDDLVGQRRDLWLRRHRLQLELDAVDAELLEVERRLREQLADAVVAMVERHSPTASSATQNSPPVSARAREGTAV